MFARSDWVFQTALFSTIGALRAPVLHRHWRVIPPEAGKSKPPAVRVVVDSFYRSQTSGGSKLRIISGELKGRKLKSIGGTKTRPTADRTREAIFNILGLTVRSAVVLDLFAGTGALGIEALSRGAQSVVLVDNDKDSIRVLQENLKKVSRGHQAKTIQWDITRNLNCLRSHQPAFTLIFLDPPYNQNMIEPTLINLHSSRCIEGGARLVIEHSQREPLSLGGLPFEINDRRRYGKTLVSFLTYVL